MTGPWLTPRPSRKRLGWRSATRRKPAAAVAAAAVAVPAAWSGGSAGTTVKVGLIAPVQAPFFSDTQSVGAAKAAIRALNAKGGLHGHPIELVFCNEKNLATQASTCARQLV